MITPTFSARIMDGKLRFFDKERLKEWLKKLTGKPLTVTIKPKQKKRTELQNNLYWLWLTIIAEETGQDKDDIHDFYKTKFLTRTIHIKGMDLIKREAKVIGSTATLNTRSFGEYLDKVQSHAAQFFGVTLPNSEDYYQN